jgi:uncharacterized protein YndB with AHSA1/START domain
MMATHSGSASVTLPAETQILITRHFAAPRRLVYRAYTTPGLIARWWAGKRGTVTSAEVDLRVGGRWRYVMVTSDGYEVAFHGDFREIIENERIVTTEVYEGAPASDEDVLNIVTFADAGDGASLSILTECPSREVRDAIIESGMEGGMQEGMDLLEEVARSLA